MSGFISRMCLLCRCLFGAGCRREAGHGGPGGCRLLPNGETSTVGSLFVDCRGCGTGSGRAARCACVLLQCLFDRFGSVFPQCGLMVFPGVVIVSR